MRKMKWTKPSAETVAYFERIAPGPPIVARRMFGMPCRFLNGHMLVGVFGNTFMLHLSASDRAECLRAGARPFAPMGRAPAKEYVDVKPGTFGDRELKEWIVRGMRYLASLPPKLKRKRAKARGNASKAPAPKNALEQRPAKQSATQRAAKKKAPASRPAKKKAAPKRVTPKKPAAKRSDETASGRARASGQRAR